MYKRQEILNAVATIETETSNTNSVSLSSYPNVVDRALADSDNNEDLLEHICENLSNETGYCVVSVHL
ncbi:hypothetical protein AB4254_11000 [Vibrio breoganii]